MLPNPATGAYVEKPSLVLWEYPAFLLGIADVAEGDDESALGAGVNFSVLAIRARIMR